MPSDFARTAWKFFSLTGRAAKPPHDNTSTEEPAEDLRIEPQRPNTGRSSSIGRKVEKPGSGRSAGPSGQHDAFQHNPDHTNK